ncbi:insulinase family protein [Patescibacteria group bacterium]|nr:insulinase family protein [Patescibacteria group bacterium]
MKTPYILNIKNGLTLCIIENEYSESVTLHLKGHAGSNYEGRDEIGAAHFIEHYLLNLPQNEKITRQKDAILKGGGKIIGVTSRDDVLFMVKVLKEYFDTALLYILTILNNDITYNEAAFESTRNAVLQEIEANNLKLSRILSNSTYSIMFPKQRIGLPNTGKTEHAKKLTFSSLKSFHAGNYSYDNFTLVISGNIKKKQVLEFLNGFDFPTGSQELQNKNTIDLKNSHNYKLNTLIKPGFLPCHIKIDFPSLKYSDDKSYILNLLALILKLSLNRALKENLPYINVECFNYSSGTFGIFSVYATLEGNNLISYLNILRNVIDGINSISPECLYDCKKVYKSNLLFSLEKTSSIAEYYSNCITHGNKNQNHSYELRYIDKLIREELIRTTNNLFKYKPKVTLLLNSPISGKTENKIKQILG